jgi:UDP-N-acetylglucosamine diphosphorylase/glucosamine-1-phosphate N-acetyltransferase
MKINLFEDSHWNAFLPLCYTRPVGALRVGILTIAEKYERALNAEVGHVTRASLHGLFNFISDASYQINARILPTSAWMQTLSELKPGQRLVKGAEVLAERMGESTLEIIECGEGIVLLQGITDVFTYNAMALKEDYAWMTKDRLSAHPHASVTLIGSSDQLFIEEGAHVFASVLNTTEGPIYIGRDAEVMEGCLVRGPFALCDHATLKMGTKIYGGTTIGPHCKVGGEVSNSVFMGYSNKAHDGFVGNSVIGEWCNLGADTNTSNLKNNYSEVRIWSPAQSAYVGTGLTFCGLLMGDHSKCGINTMFNTGTVVGVCANVYGGGFPSKYIPSFSWGGSDGMVLYDLNKALDTIRKVMARRHQELSADMTRMLSELHADSAVME